MADEIVVRGFSLTKKEIEIINRVSDQRRLFNGSAALRMIIQEWDASQQAPGSDRLAPRNNGKGGGNE